MDYQSHIETVIHYINMQIRHNWSLESDDAFNESTCINTLSQVACLSKRNFQLVFKSIMKESPGQYINRVRLEYGLQLLKEGRYSQKEIAERTGWTNDTAFYNAFKKRYLQSPAKYKSENFVSDVISDTIDCSLLELSEIPIIFFIYQGSYTDFVSGCFEERSWELLYDYAQSNNLLPEKEEYWGICYDDRDITVDEKCCFYAGLTVRHMPNLKVDNEIKAMLLPKAEYAVYVHKGIYDKLDSFYNAILQQIPEGYCLGEGLILERYLNSVADTSEEDLLTEVLLPVVKAKSNLL
ncbi:AraC family transcriptional regulator [Parabacteroides sp. GYB001]|uniref:AraC family transcriptional regulator n=1 Tax=Parabacteroides leei TaxID=2939491 RepID=UPI0020171CAD|nr:AraC family transcriptional regulator [Parabacteroides leei]MCL3849933.1 AraC family transcriptional regulator [Parabacteroides leei]